MTIGLARKGCIAVTVLATVAGCGSASSISAPGDTWSVASDVTNGGWEIELLTADEELQKQFEEDKGIFEHQEGSPVIWLKKVDGVENYEPVLWLLDSSSNRIPLPYHRFSSGGSTYLAASLSPAPSKSITASGLELQVRDEIVATWRLEAATYEAPASWPPVSQVGADMQMAGISFKLVPIQSLRPSGETTPAAWGPAETLQGLEGADPDFKYELRYSVGTADDSAIRSIDVISPPAEPSGQTAVGEFVAEVLCRLMKYTETQFDTELELDSGAIADSRAELEAGRAVVGTLEIDGRSLDVYGIYVDENAGGAPVPGLWLRVKATGTTALDYTADFDAGWIMLIVQGTSFGNKIDQYQLDDGSTVLVYNAVRRQDDWQDSPIQITGTARSVAAYEEAVAQLPVTVMMVVKEAASVSQSEETP